MHASRTLRAAAAVLAVSAAGAAAEAAATSEAGPPARVVSLNLCTDQMALLLAAPAQLVSVSFLAHDPSAAVLWRRARGIPGNHGLAEQVFPLAPDLVLAGAFTSRATVAMLRRLGVRVEEFPLENDFDDIRANLRRMGALLGAGDRAEALVAELDAGLAEAAPPEGARRPRAAPYYAAGFTSGAGSLADEIIRAAGLRNIAAERGLRGMTRLPVEVLAMEAPELLITGAPMDPPALAQAAPEHPALRAARGAGGAAALTGPHWTCGAPFTAEAVRRLAEARAALPHP